MLEKFLDAPWFEKLFWLFFVAVAAFILYTFLAILYQSIRMEMPRPKRRARSAGGGVGFVGTDVGAAPFEGASADASFEASSDSGSSDSGGGGGDFSGGGGESGGGGSTGGW